MLLAAMYLVNVCLAAMYLVDMYLHACRLAGVTLGAAHPAALLGTGPEAHCSFYVH
jgi:hypothetical protein